MEQNMSAKDFDRRVESLWATHFGCAAEDFAREGTTLVPRDRLIGQRVTHIVYIHRRAVAELDPDLEWDLRAILERTGGGSVLSSELLVRAWGKERIAEDEAGLIFHLRPGHLVRPELDPKIALRRLTAGDQADLDALRKRCTDYEIDDAFVEIEHETAWGCFRGAELVAVGSAYRRNGFMDFGVLTDPAQRGLGLARHIVCALADDSLERGMIPQYRCNRVNQASRRVAEAAGFTLYFTTESVKLAP